MSEKTSDLPALIGRFIQIYQALNSESLSQLTSIYHKDIEFIDPIHHILGLPDLIQYFDGMYQNMISCDFDIDEINGVDNQFFLNWTMQFRHKKIGRAKLIKVVGLSQLKIQDDLVIYHRDYFDLSEMIFDHLPLIGGITQYVKRKAAQ